MLGAPSAPLGPLSGRDTAIATFQTRNLQRRLGFLATKAIVESRLPFDDLPTQSGLSANKINQILRGWHHDVTCRDLAIFFAATGFDVRLTISPLMDASSPQLVTTV